MTNSEEVRTTWDSVMDETQNPLKNYSLPAAHMLMQMLAWMWSANTERIKIVRKKIKRLSKMNEDT